MDLTRDHLFSLDLDTRVAVEIPELGGTLYIKRLSGAEGFALSIESFADAEMTEQERRALLLIYTVCNSAGAPLFTRDDIQAILQLPFVLVYPLVVQANTLNGFDIPVTELKKNSLVIRNGFSGIESPVHSE